MSQTTAAEKGALRRQVRATRAKLAAAARAEASAAIRERLFGWAGFQRATGVHCFVSMAEEVDTGPIFERCWADGKKTFVPFQDKERGALGWARRNPGDPLVEAPFGVLEPPRHLRRPVAAGEIDLVLVPGVAFDREGYRLGYGKGFYDQFLGSLVLQNKSRDAGPVSGAHPMPGPGAIQAIALAFSVQMVPRVPREHWDVRIKMILTEREFIIVG